MRVVLDTNIVLSSVLWRGTPYRLLQLLRARPDCALVTSSPMIEELARILTRPSLAQRMATVGTDAASVLRDYMAVVKLVAPVDITPVCRDPDDDLVLATALAAQAGTIISGDDDLLSLRCWQGINIATAASALELLTS